MGVGGMGVAEVGRAGTVLRHLERRCYTLQVIPRAVSIFSVTSTPKF